MGEGWRPLRRSVSRSRLASAEGWTVEAADILLLDHSERDKRGGRHQGGGRIGPGVGTKRGGLWRRAVDSLSHVCPGFPTAALLGFVSYFSQTGENPRGTGEEKGLGL